MTFVLQSYDISMKLESVPLTHPVVSKSSRACHRPVTIPLYVAPDFNAWQVRPLSEALPILDPEDVMREPLAERSIASRFIGKIRVVVIPVRAGKYAGGALP
jgi:hypothetical protein